LGLVDFVAVVGNTQEQLKRGSEKRIRMLPGGGILDTSEKLKKN
jgi:hypothetical protein